MNQCVFRNSALNLPLKLSMKLLLVGFSGRESRRRAWSVQFEDNAFVVSPQIKVSRDKLRSLIHFADTLERLNNIFATIAEPRVYNWRESTERIDNRQDADLGSGSQLIMDKVHCPCLVDLNSVFPIISKLGLHPALRTVGGQMIHGIICFSA
jgi:hypothetical protein